MREIWTKRLEELASSHQHFHVPMEFRLRGGSPADSILDSAQTLPCDLIVMGTHGRRGISHTISGSVAEAVLRKARCPVVAVRSPKFGPGHSRVIPTENISRNAHLTKEWVMTSAVKLTSEKETIDAVALGGIATIHRAAGWHEGSDFEEGLRIVARAGVSRRTRSRGLARRRGHRDGRNS